MTASELYEFLLQNLELKIKERCRHWQNSDCDFCNCFCAAEAADSKNHLALIIELSETQGWKLMPMTADDDMAEAANFATSRWHDIKGSQLTVNREKAKIRWRAMADKVPPVKDEP